MNKLLLRLKKIEKDLDQDTAKALKKVAVKIRDDAKQFVPVDTGSLRRSIRLQVYARQKGIIKRVAISAGGFVVNPKTGNKVNYAAFVEFGTRHQYAQPYLRPALEKHKREVLRAVRLGVSK